MPSEEVIFRPAEISKDQEEVTVVEGLTLFKGHVSSDEAAALLEDIRVGSSDLIPDVYEGGFKLWECATDLCRFLLTKYALGTRELIESSEPRTKLQNKKVLELGCGHGLPGIVAVLAGAEVHFQDFNKQVLTSLTIPNVLANVGRTPQQRSRLPTRFFTGDWACVGECLTGKGFGGHYDVILTSESIYSLESQERLLECIKQLLQPPHGVAYIAAKTYYFGVGGGTTSFLALVKREGLFECESVFRVEEPGSGNVREILQLKFPEAIMPYFL
ncbi:MAG: hypothetical protein WDW38_002662 [Sanguina aurantia]